jgi:thiamine biosynthesis lipoprotein
VETYTFSAMSTSLTAAAQGPAAEVREGFRQVEALVAAHERRFTRFSEQSELSALNRAAGGWFAASPEMIEVVSLAQRYHRETGGLFNPGILNALERAGYDRSIEKLRALERIEIPAHWPAPAGAMPEFRRVEIDERRGAIRLPQGLRIDLGGIAKGWIAEQAARRLSQFAPVCSVEAGGDLFAIGVPAGEPGWMVGLEDPFHPEENLLVLAVGPGAVATSSVIKRRWKAAPGAPERHHLIDPRSGEPAETPWACMTVIAEHAAQAEVLAKAALIGGNESLFELRARYPRAVFLAVDWNGQCLGTENSQEVLYEPAR